MPQANSYDAYPDFVIRSPLFSLRNIENIPENPAETELFLKDQWDNPLVKDAILAASPSFYKRLNNDIEKNTLSNRIINSFLRYYIRMSYRSTPFGLFAGVGMGQLSSLTNLHIKDPHKHRLKLRLDMEYLGALVMKFISDPDICRGLLFRANTSLYQIGAHWRYIEIFVQTDNLKKYRIVSVERSPAIDKIIGESKNLKEFENLVSQIVNLGYTKKKSEGFVHELIDSQILIPDIFPNLSGLEFMDRMGQRLSCFKDKKRDVLNFLTIVKTIGEIVTPGFFNVNYPAIDSLGRQSDVKYNHSHFIQLDMQTAFERAEIDNDLSNKVLMGIRILKALSRQKPNRVLQEFREHFISRFGSQEVSLPEVMDSDYGIGLSGPPGQQMADPGPLLEGLDFPVNTGHDKPDSPHPMLYEKIRDFNFTGDYYIYLDKQDIKELNIRKGKWPCQLYAMCRLSGPADDSQIIFDLAAAGNPSPILGRFGFLEPKGQLNKHIDQLVSDDINYFPDSILADIVHLPEDRTGNILQSPSFYDWEICYLASPGTKAKVIIPDEILVSVINNKVVLKHKSLGKIILPRLSNAHNYRSRQLPLYQFLAECANQDSSSGFSPNWGWMSSMNYFLPGIKYRNLIISQARWSIAVDEILKESGHDKTDLYNIIMAWAKRNNLPEKVVWADGDQEMPIDWSNFNIVMSVWEKMRKRNILLFKDYPFKYGSPVNGGSGTFANEVLFSYKKTNE